nr:hypothetical protein [Tanacetum cinerariifolium]
PPVTTTTIPLLSQLNHFPLLSHLITHLSGNTPGELRLLSPHPPVADEPASPLGGELEINSLKARIKVLEDKDRGVAEQSGDDAPIKGRRLDEEEEAAERVNDDTEEMEIILTSMDAASILTSRGVQVVPTAAEVAT